MTSWNYTNKKTLVRADLNVPLHKSKIIDDERLRALQPTLDYLIAQKATIILATHIGRPIGCDPFFSTEILMPWFEKHGYTIIYHPDLTPVPLQPGAIFLLPNLRYFPQEQNPNHAFAQALAHLADYFIQDAFGALHRNDSSIALLPEQFAPDHRSLGLLTIQELKVITLLKNPPSPFTLIMGGGKASEKIALIEHLITKADYLLICPALVFTFMKAQGVEVGNSLVDTAAIATCKKIIAQYPHKLMFPVDYQVAQGSIEGALSYKNGNALLHDDVGISIGPKTINLFSDIIKKSKTVFFNGALGFIERKETMNGMAALLHAMSSAPATSFVAGGDSLAALTAMKIKGITHCITGGGSALTLLSGQQLPGLLPFLKNRAKTN
jgi:3-phosphoglycerate kinase